MRRILYIWMATCLLSCTKGYRIKGVTDVTYVEGKVVSLMTTKDNEWHLLDSCEILHGQFRMNGRIDSVVIGTLFLDGKPVLPIIVEPGKVDIELSNWQLTVTGTTLNDSLYSFIRRKHKLDLRVAEMERMEPQMIMNGYSQEAIQARVDSVYQQLSDEMQALVCGFIGDNYHNVLGLCGFSMLCNGLPYPIITPLIQQVIDEAPQEFLDHPSIREFLQMAHENTDYDGWASVVEN